MTILRLATRVMMVAETLDDIADGLAEKADSEMFDYIEGIKAEAAVLVDMAKEIEALPGQSRRNVDDTPV